MVQRNSKSINGNKKRAVSPTGRAFPPVGTWGSNRVQLLPGEPQPKGAASRKVCTNEKAHEQAETGFTNIYPASLCLLLHNKGEQMDDIEITLKLTDSVLNLHTSEGLNRRGKIQGTSCNPPLEGNAYRDIALPTRKN